MKSSTRKDRNGKLTVAYKFLRECAMITYEQISESDMFYEIESHDGQHMIDPDWISDFMNDPIHTRAMIEAIFSNMLAYYANGFPECLEDYRGEDGKLEWHPDMRDFDDAADEYIRNWERTYGATLLEDDGAELMSVIHWYKVKLNGEEILVKREDFPSGRIDWTDAYGNLLGLNVLKFVKKNSENFFVKKMT